MRERFFTLISSGLLMLASASAASACTSIYYQPKLPEVLRK